jgi:Carbohydrate esterase, sialic acid-specific acetylesterase
MTRLFAATIVTFLIPQFAAASDYHLYYLGGQSNMDGYGRVNELPDDLQGPVDGVMIFHGNTSPDGTPVDGRGVWSVLGPGHGVGYSTDGNTENYSDRVGVEVTFARRLRELYPDRHIALIKYSRGGTSIDCEAARNFGCWDPDFSGGDGAGAGVNQYDHFLATLRNATEVNDIDGDGEPDRLIPAGIVWMQGESDAALNADVAFRYRDNLRRLMDLLRAALRTDDLPVAVGRISDSGQDADGRVWDYGDVVRAAEAAWVESDGHAALVASTDAYGYSDPYHYDTAGYIDLGRKFADALQAIKE